MICEKYNSLYYVEFIDILVGLQMVRSIDSCFLQKTKQLFNIYPQRCLQNRLRQHSQHPKKTDSDDVNMRQKYK